MGAANQIMTTVSTADVGQTRLNQRELQYYCVTVQQFNLQQ